MIGWKEMLLRTPVIGGVARVAASWRSRWTFRNSSDYWETRYARGGNSGDGSYGRLAQFKAELLNDFVARQQIRTVVELGCGDGEQLRLASYPRYLGVDVSHSAVALCQQKFARDTSKSFLLASEFEPTNAAHQAEFALSLDVIYHLVEDTIFNQYMGQLFAAAQRYVAIYSSNHEETVASAHVRHRRFSDWIAARQPAWRLLKMIPNRYPVQAGERETSHADMYLWERC
ncbi:MAG TPA: class I SAM-dependent methyltransferase [Pirellulaceae bacterium]|nr:class I SAM-dependent methyltransferase [Pirellulaceae bacterium]